MRAEIAADRRTTFRLGELRTAGMPSPREGRSDLAFVKRKPFARYNPLIRLRLGLNGFRGKPSKTRGNGQKPPPISRIRH
jgi:hypothetical protein